MDITDNRNNSEIKAKELTLSDFTEELMNVIKEYKLKILIAIGYLVVIGFLVFKLMN